MLMRSLFVLAAFVANTATAATAFPPAASPEQPASAHTFGSAAGSQQTLAAVSNGQMSFAVWLDQRSGATDLYGSRIDAGGAPLDPLGIVIATGATGGDVFWNGTAFVVISEKGQQTTFTFITPDGAIADRKSKQIVNQFTAMMGTGSDTRVLFVGGGIATILDNQANIVTSSVDLAIPFPEAAIAAASGGSEFLILHTMPGTDRPLSADRLDRNGQFLGKADTGLTLARTGRTLALAGSPDDYLLVSRGPTDHTGFLAHLDRNGIKKTTGNFSPNDKNLRVPYPAAKPAALFDGTVYQIAWTTSEGDGSAHSWRISEQAGGGGSLPPPDALLDWTGTGYGVVMARSGSGLLVITDALRYGVSTSIDPVVSMTGSTLHRALSSTATLQAAPQIASSSNGYVVVWNEYGPDGSSHLFLRRFTQALTGSPVDPAPIEVASDPSGRTITASVTAAGDTYVIAWTSATGASGDTYVLRRFSATTGSWLDAEPVLLANNTKELVLGSNGEGALAVYAVTCQTYARCPRARAIATDSGAPLRLNETIPTGIEAYQLSIASNGHDYLMAWNDNFCSPLCDVFVPSRILALRLASDGNALDPAPLVVDGTPNVMQDVPSAAWGGNSYAVSWRRSQSIFGAHVSSAGVTDAPRQILPGPSYTFSHRLVATGASLLLLTTQESYDGVSTTTTTSGVGLDPQSLLVTGDLALLVAEQPPYGSVSAAPLPTGLVIAYDRVDPSAANVARVFTRAFGSIPRRRAAR